MTTHCQQTVCTAFGQMNIQVATGSFHHYNNSIAIRNAASHSPQGKSVSY